MKKCMVALLSTALMFSSMQGNKQEDAMISASEAIKKVYKDIKKYINPVYLHETTEPSEFDTALNQLSSSNTKILLASIEFSKARDKLSKMLNVKDKKSVKTFNQAIDLFIDKSDSLFELSRKENEEYIDSYQKTRSRISIMPINGARTIQTLE